MKLQGTFPRKESLPCPSFGHSHFNAPSRKEKLGQGDRSRSFFAFPDLEFEVAAMLLTRVISKPNGRLCLDLGHKAVAAERPIDKRAWFPDMPEAKPFLQSEEHFVLDAPNAGDFAVGDALLAVPWHVCPKESCMPTLT
jgi:D-serine deaminase-like pyridoxal phosphate-dependent protein